jgi:hypothetical protein
MFAAYAGHPAATAARAALDTAAVAGTPVIDIKPEL